MGIVVRPYQQQDFSNYVLLCLEAESREPSGRPSAPQGITERFRRPGYDPANCLLLAENGGSLIGFAEITPEPGIDRAILDIWVRPEYRRRGAGTRLLSDAKEQTGRLGIGRVQAVIKHDNSAAIQFLENYGFRLVRTFLELEANITDVALQFKQTDSRGIETFRAGREKLLADLQNCAFSGQWGYNPNSEDDIAYRLSLGHRLPQDVLLYRDHETYAGYCWVELRHGGRGRVCMIGILPEYRGKGLGEALLAAGLDRLAGRGAETVRLTVDKNNKIALKLYEKAGFRTADEYYWYESEVT